MDSYEDDTDLPGASRNHVAASNKESAVASAAGHAAAWTKQWAGAATKTVSSWTVPKYGLPDKNVASQVLMYRQLLHTACRPGLLLSRDYQATEAQQKVKHMPWWSEGMEETKRMIISYDNLIRRLWLHGAILPFATNKDATATATTETLLDEDTAMPPIPHAYWVDRCGFQQPDPVTDFRSGGILSLAMMVHLVESCPVLHRRFVDGDASVLPFGITSINITDMIAKFLMLSKAVDRMDALMSQKPFWRMFADPNALLASQEVAMDMLADVLVEIKTLRQCTDPAAVVTVFDFAQILQVTEQRVASDLLGAGPKTVPELRALAAKLKNRYADQLQRKVQKKLQKAMAVDVRQAVVEDNSAAAQAEREALKQKVLESAQKVGDATKKVGMSVGNAAKEGVAAASTVLRNFKAPPLFSRKQQVPESDPDEKAPASDPPAPAVVPTTTNLLDDLLETPPPAAGATATDPDADWATDIPGATDAVSNFSIGDDDDEDL